MFISILPTTSISNNFTIETICSNIYVKMSTPTFFVIAITWKQPKFLCMGGGGLKERQRDPYN